MRSKFCSKLFSHRPTALCIVGMLIVIFFGMFNLGKNTSLRVVGDEFGYWTSGAVLSGFDWSSVASYNNYYAFGYGAILAPILQLSIPQTIKYQIAIIINVLMLVFVYLMIYHQIKKNGTQSLCATLIALVSTLYSANIAYSQFTLVETLILFLYMLSMFSLSNYLQTHKLKYSVILPIVMGYMLSVHMRTIGIFLVMIGFFLLYCLRKKQYKAILFFIFSTIVVLLVYFFVSRWYKQAIGIQYDTNQVTGQVGRIKQLLSKEGIIEFLAGFGGKTAYSFLTTFSIATIATIRIIINFIVEIKAKEVRKETILGIVLVVNLFVMEAISTVFLLDYTTRYDLLTYGRYHDFTLCALIAYELYMWIIKHEKLRTLVFVLSALCAIALTFFIALTIPNLSQTGHLNLFSPGISYFLKHEQFFILLFLNLLIILIYYLVNIDSISFQIKKYMRIAMITVPMLVMFIYLSYSSLFDTYNWSVQGCMNEERLAEQISDDKSIQNIYYYVPDNSIDIDYLQFLLNDKPITCINNEKYFSGINENDCILTTHNSKLITELWKEQYELFGSSSYLKCWKKK